MQLISSGFSPSQLLSKQLLSKLASAVLPETTPPGICMLSFPLVSCKVLLITTAQFLLVVFLFGWLGFGAFCLLVSSGQG